jgi:hypothetical protein
VAARKFGSRSVRWLALKTATRLAPPLKRHFPVYETVVPLIEAGDATFVREEQPLLLTPSEAEYAKRFDPPLPGAVERSIALVKVNGASVLGSTGAVIDERKGVLFQSRYTADRYGLGASYHDFIDLPSAGVAKPDANYFSMVGEYRGHRHFFHFLFDRLPRIFYLFSRFGMQNVPFAVLTNEHLPEFQQDIYHFLAARHPNLRFLPMPERERWQLPTLYLIDDMQPVRRTFLPPDAVEFFRDLVVGGYGLSPRPPHRRLYINRSDARKRSIRNEAEIWPSFARRGFESIAAGNLSFREQVALFSEAEMIAGPHGAGFSNLLFASQAAKVLEISNVERVKSVYFLLAKALGQHYRPVVGSKGDRNEWFSADPQAVEVALSALEGGRA